MNITDICIYMYIFKYRYTYTYTYSCIYIHIYTCTYACMYIYIYIERERERERDGGEDRGSQRLEILVEAVGAGLRLLLGLAPRLLRVPPGGALISQKVFIKSVCNSSFPQKSVNVFFTLVMIEDTLTDLWGG